MNIYPPEVSQKELQQAEFPVDKEWVILARALGSAAMMGVSTTDCFEALVAITPNVFLRLYLIETLKMVEEGWSIATALEQVDTEDLVDETFLAAVRLGEATGELGSVLLTYADRLGYGGNDLAKVIGRSESVQLFTSLMYVSLHPHGCNVVEALCKAVIVTDHHEPNSIWGGLMTDFSLLGFSGLLRLHPHHFDPLYVALVKAAEGKVNERGFETAFELLVA